MMQSIIDRFRYGVRSARNKRNKREAKPAHSKITNLVVDPDQLADYQEALFQYSAVEKLLDRQKKIVIFLTTNELAWLPNNNITDDTLFHVAKVVQKGGEIDALSLTKTSLTEWAERVPEDCKKMLQGQLDCLFVPPDKINDEPAQLSGTLLPSKKEFPEMLLRSKRRRYLFLSYQGGGYKLTDVTAASQSILRQLQNEVFEWQAHEQISALTELLQPQREHKSQLFAEIDQANEIMELLEFMSHQVREQFVLESMANQSLRFILQQCYRFDYRMNRRSMAKEVMVKRFNECVKDIRLSQEQTDLLAGWHRDLRNNYVIEVNSKRLVWPYKY